MASFMFIVAMVEYYSETKSVAKVLCFHSYNNSSRCVEKSGTVRLYNNVASNS